MPEATSLGDLLRIRAVNRELIDSVNANLGSSLGFKRPTGGAITDQPAIQIECFLITRSCRGASAFSYP